MGLPIGTEICPEFHSVPLRKSVTRIQRINIFIKFVIFQASAAPSVVSTSYSQYVKHTDLFGGLEYRSIIALYAALATGLLGSFYAKFCHQMPNSAGDGQPRR